MGRNCKEIFSVFTKCVAALPVPKPGPTNVPVGAGVGKGFGLSVELVGQDGITQQDGSLGSGMKSQPSTFSYCGHLQKLFIAQYIKTIFCKVQICIKKRKGNHPTNHGSVFSLFVFLIF